MSNKLRDKLIHYEADPPLNTWDAVAASLDKQPTLAQKLHQFEEAPDPEIWRKIEYRLNTQDAPGRIIPFYRRNKTFLKYTAVAAILITLATTSALLINRKSIPDETINVQTNNQQPKNDAVLPVQNETEVNNTSTALI